MFADALVEFPDGIPFFHDFPGLNTVNSSQFEVYFRYDYPHSYCFPCSEVVLRLDIATAATMCCIRMSTWLQIEFVTNFGQISSKFDWFSWEIAKIHYCCCYASETRRNTVAVRCTCRNYSGRCGKQLTGHVCCWFVGGNLVWEAIFSWFSTPKY